MCNNYVTSYTIHLNSSICIPKFPTQIWQSSYATSKVGTILDLISRVQSLRMSVTSHSEKDAR